jgi:Acyl-protein synthetase, LuxE
MPDSNQHFLHFQYEKIFAGLPGDFNSKAMEIFRIQFAENVLYRQFANRFCSDPETVKVLTQIPFLPISFFKTDLVKTGEFDPEIIFESSGTSGQTPSRHPVRDLNLYHESFIKGFDFFYGDLKQYCILGLLPAYLERTGSSLVYMVDELIRLSGHPDSGFYLYDFEKLQGTLKKIELDQQKAILIGVSFALLDFAEKFSIQLSHTSIMETGGMKGRREELTRNEMHDVLKKRLGVAEVHSEYGMTELLSQAYSSGNGIFKPVPWMKALVRDEDDPLCVRKSGEGLLNIIDLANRHSCAFIATDDVVKLNEDGSFEILGRMDNSDIRGCSLLAV